MKTDKKPVVLCAISGGIAVYKAVDVVSRLVKTGAEVHVVMTPSACKFVAPLTFQAIIGRRVITQNFPDSGDDDHSQIYPHIYPATEADLFVVVPATAQTIAQIAHGGADNVVTASALALPTTCSKVICPAMNSNMWLQESTQDNIKTLKRRGWQQIGPEQGLMACKSEGPGRMTEPVQIAEELKTLLTRSMDLTGKRVLILSGPTHEYLDTVRYIGNASSGRMGKALAEEALARGAWVDFVTGPVASEQLPRNKALDIHPIVSAKEMLDQAEICFKKADIVIFAAAVADYRPAEPSGSKLPKHPEGFNVKLVCNPDIAATLGAKKRAGQQLIGFALQDDAQQQLASDKLIRKKLDGIILNAPEALGCDRAHYQFQRAQATFFDDWGALSKRNCATRLFDLISV